jgi:hypothetical protein
LGLPFLQLKSETYSLSESNPSMLYNMVFEGCKLIGQSWVTDFGVERSVVLDGLTEHEINVKLEEIVKQGRPMR